MAKYRLPDARLGKPVGRDGPVSPSRPGSSRRAVARLHRCRYPDLEDAVLVTGLHVGLRRSGRDENVSAEHAVPQLTPRVVALLRLLLLVALCRNVHTSPSRETSTSLVGSIPAISTRTTSVPFSVNSSARIVLEPFGHDDERTTEQRRPVGEQGLEEIVGPTHHGCLPGLGLPHHCHLPLLSLVLSLGSASGPSTGRARGPWWQRASRRSPALTQGGTPAARRRRACGPHRRRRWDRPVPCVAAASLSSPPGWGSARGAAG